MTPVNSESMRGGTMPSVNAGADSDSLSGDTVQASGHQQPEIEISFGGTQPSVNVGGASHTEISGSAPADSSTGSDLPERLGGYRITEELDRGAMGAVYLATQSSLNRQVALKVIQKRWTSDPSFLARFTREAYAAAQLTHPNVVQIHDLGSDRGTSFFSMEFVRGCNLGDVVREQGKLAPEVAVSYLLQAARGLKCAHDQGMVHRDVKPDNLMLSDDGFVKVADLGLVKVEDNADIPMSDGGELDDGGSSRLTGVNRAMGTPDYMAPEQADSAADVDHRADIYSLGCTLYTMLTGQPPFSGTTIREVITKHKSEPMVRPDVVAKRVPAELSEFTMRMTAKRLDDRYAHLGEVIKDMEEFLGVENVGDFSPTEEHVDILERNVEAFTNSKSSRLRCKIALSFLAVSGVLTIGSLLIGQAGLAVTFLTSSLAGTMGVFVLNGVKQQTYLFDKTRQLLFESRWLDYATWALGALLGLGVCALAGLLPWLLVGIVFGVGAAAAYWFLITRQLSAERAPHLEEVEQLLKRMRPAWTR